MKRHDHDVGERLPGFDVGALEREGHSVIAVADDLTLTYVNPAYVQFSAQNDGEPAVTERYPLGTSVLDAITGPLKGYYQERFTDVLRTGEPWHQEYVCTSPSIHREFYQVVCPTEDRRGLVIVHSLKVEHPVTHDDRVAYDPVDARYRQATGMLSQCSDCRRTKRNDGSDVWDWVPAWVARAVLDVSHSICPPCLAFYWR